MLIITTLSLPVVAVADGWSSFHKVFNTYFSVDKTVVVLEEDFHTCGNNNWGKLDVAAVGENFAQTFNAAVISAISERRGISVDVEGCSGNRANIVGVRIKT